MLLNQIEMCALACYIIEFEAKEMHEQPKCMHTKKLAATTEADLNKTNEGKKTHTHKKTQIQQSLFTAAKFITKIDLPSVLQIAFHK